MTATYRELLAQSRDAFNAHDPEAWIEAWNPAREEGDPGYHGHNCIRAWFEDVEEMFSEIRVDLSRFREIGSRLLVLGEMEARSRATGEAVSSEVAWVVESRGERLQRGWSYGSHAEGERAAREESG